MTSNMVLRFRDLVAETIPEHLKYIKDFGYVWWGWWNKPNEKVPIKEFRLFQEIIEKKKHMWIFLADSGTLRLYKAKLIDIDFTEDEEPKECKEIAGVPEYYSTKNYKAWFCFSNIINAVPDEIRVWAYDKSIDFLYVDDIDHFQNRRVSSIQEMLNHCHRTIYFIQEFDPKQHIECLRKDTQNDQKHQKISLELECYVNEILTLIEDINRTCHYSSKPGSIPIKMPPYPKKMENSLKHPAVDEKSFQDFGSNIYNLFKDGHKQVLGCDRAIISKSEFLGFAYSLLEIINIFRCDFNHLDAKDSKKQKLGRIFYEVCGKNILDDADSKIKFQLELLKRTVEVLKKENELVNEKLKQQSDRNGSAKLTKLKYK